MRRDNFAAGFDYIYDDLLSAAFEHVYQDMVEENIRNRSRAETVGFRVGLRLEFPDGYYALAVQNRLSAASPGSAADFALINKLIETVAALKGCSLLDGILPSEIEKARRPNIWLSFCAGLDDNIHCKADGAFCRIFNQKISLPVLIVKKDGETFAFDFRNDFDAGL